VHGNEERAPARPILPPAPPFWRFRKSPPGRGRPLRAGRVRLRSGDGHNVSEIGISAYPVLTTAGSRYSGG
jgi:hypothetical protein